ncbi:Protein O-mannosyl-transferase 2-like protein, partial [Leptotrombidium deliense]
AAMAEKRKSNVNGKSSNHCSAISGKHNAISAPLWWLSFLAVCTLAFTTRFYKISEPDHVCWDETHFGKMASWYINRTFFFDVHPPLGKMLIALSGYLTGYNGTFAFSKPGDKFDDHNYVGMRTFCAFLGTMIIPFSFVSVWEMTSSLPASVLAATFVTFDVGVLTLSQYILLDPILLFFIFGSFMCSTKFFNQKEFTLFWYFWLTLTALFIACAISVKFVGLFIVVFVGLKTIKELWEMLGNISLSFNAFMKHFIVLFTFLIVLPTLIYLSFFWIHLKVLYRSGSGDGFFSSAFQSQLVDNSLYNASMPLYVAYGAVITLKNHRTGGGYLHSHWHLYPEGIGARQQQVTTYSHKDDNNKWMIKKYDSEPNVDTDPVELVKNGDLIRLEHVVTTRNLHSHKELAPVTKKHYQTTCYGEQGVGDANDVWKVELLNGGSRENIKTVASRFRLIHYLSNCALHSHSKQLPKWGYEQMEVTCNPNLLDKNSIWNVEDNAFARLPNISFEVYAPSFLEKVVESHAVMFRGNAGLKPKEGEVTSRPWQWPVNYRGQFFSGNQYKIYLLGNPVIWWSNLVLLFIYVFIQLVITIRRQRGCEESSEFERINSRLTSAAGSLFVAWLLHYLPFYAMGRVLYFHHYFPAAIFSSMLSAVVIDFTIEAASQYFVKDRASDMQHFLFGTLVSMVAYSFYLFSPLSYGITQTAQSNNTLNSLKWLETWEF